MYIVNKLPKYLWYAWKKDLKPIGATWQKFMRLLRYRADVGVMWFKVTLSWEEFIQKVSALVQGPIGKNLRKDEPRVPAHDLAQWQFPPFADWESAVVHAAKVDELSRASQAILEQQTEQSVRIVEIKSAVVAPSTEAISRAALHVIRMTADASAVTKEYNAELDHVKKLIDRFQPKEAIAFIGGLEKWIPSDVGGLVRYRLLTNKAIAKAAIGEERDAGVLFIEAHQYNPDDEKAICNRAVGHLLLSQRDEAITFVKRVLNRNSTSARANEVLAYCAPPDDPLDQVIERIPRALRETEGIACALAHQAYERGDIPASIHWWEVAIKKSDKARPDCWANLAGILIESLAGKFEIVSGRQVSPEDRATIERSITLLNEAITAVAHTEMIKFRVSWLVNRSAAQAFLGRIDEALADIDSALKIDPQDAGSLKQKVAILIRLSEFDKAMETLNGIAAHANLPEAAILRATMLSEVGKGEEAVRIIEDSLSKASMPAKLRAEENHLLLDIYLQRKEYEHARRISLALRSADPTDILTLVQAARIEKAAGDTTAASRLLDEALTYVSETTTSRYLFELSDELYSSERYVDAWPIFEKVADIRLDNTVTHRLLYSYYRSEEFDKALAACRAVPAKKKSRFATQIEIATLEDIHDLRAAADVCEEYLALYPDDLPMRVRRLVTLCRLGQFEQVDAFLNSPIDIQKLNLEAGLQLAGIYAERGMTRRSLEVAYELRRKYYDESRAHLRYIGLFFSREKGLDAWLAGDTVAEDTAISIRDNAGAQKWHIIENRSDASAARGELNVADPLATKALGKTVNDEIILSESAISQTKATIIEIKSKYIYALRESLEIFRVRFARAPGIERLMARLDKEEEESQEGIQSFLESISQRDKRVREVEKLYLEGGITIGAFANLIGTNVIAIWSALAGDQRCGIRCCAGTPAEREQAVSLIKNNPRVVIDITALLTCRSLQTLDLLRTVFSEILICQSTIDLLQEAISERRGIGAKGFMNVWKEGAVYYRREVTAEEIAQEIKRLEDLQEWVRSTCSTAPIRAAQSFGDQQRKQLTEVIGAAFLDTILIALDQRCPMYSDDVATRGFAKNEFGKRPAMARSPQPAVSTNRDGASV